MNKRQKDANGPRHWHGLNIPDLDLWPGDTWTVRGLRYRVIASSSVDRDIELVEVCHEAPKA